MNQRPLDERQRLVDLGPERLADALLALAQHHPRAEALVTRLTAAPSTGPRRVRAKLAGLGWRTRFVGWAESAAYAEDLQEILADIEAGTTDPQTGVELVAAFYRADAVVFEACDDSSGHVGDVFRGEGLTLFTRYAAACPDKEWLAELVLELVLQDDYGVRSGLLDTAAQYLPAEAMRRMVDGLWPRLDDAQFLVDVGRLQDCAQYLLACRDQLNDDQYYSLVPLAEAMEQKDEALVATVVYRALLESILARAQSRYYHHGARYLGRLEALSAKIAAWQGIAAHEDYAAHLRQIHARKSAFWAKCRNAAADRRAEDEESA